jgi:hypothetical protein
MTVDTPACRPVVSIVAPGAGRIELRDRGERARDGREVQLRAVADHAVALADVDRVAVAGEGHDVLVGRASGVDDLAPVSGDGARVGARGERQ